MACIVSKYNQTSHSVVNTCMIPRGQHDSPLDKELKESLKQIHATAAGSTRLYITLAFHARIGLVTGEIHYCFNSHQLPQATTPYAY